ncbi:MFS transporter [uncultured Parasphingorhabdus sp.]|uniref:MFS transporter n=1 Tax=uncultured Parasphingorhabdus sp. TaxID=2709694 RepID=UPI0030DC5848|tara:strand:- start:25455 stop:26654 length:1200 start_codon:yes stop_codon:yes gene_type:complete
MNQATTGQAGSHSAGTRHGVILLLAAMMPIMAITSLIPVLPLLFKEFSSVNGSEFLVPMALTIPALCVALFSPLAGWLSDKLGRKHLLVGALVLYAGFGIIPWFLDDLMQIIGARIALGITEAVIMTVATVMIGDYFEGARREKWIALQVGFGSIAAIILIAVGGGLGELLGSRGPFLLYLLAIPIALAAAIILFEPTVKSAVSDGVKANFPFKAVMPLILTTIGVGIIFYSIVVQLGPVLGLSGEVSPATIGMIGALTNIAVAVGSVLFNKFKQNVGSRLLIVGLVLAAIGYAGISMSTTLVLLATFAILACIGSGMLLPNMLTWTMNSLPPEMRGRGMGMWTGAFFLGQFAAPIVTASIVPITGGFAETFLAYAVVIAGAAIVVVVMNRGSLAKAAG